MLSVLFNFLVVAAVYSTFVLKNAVPCTILRSLFLANWCKIPHYSETLKHQRLNYSNLECSSICYQEVQFSETVVIQLSASLRILGINDDNNQGLRKNATNKKRFKTQTESTRCQYTLAVEFVVHSSLVAEEVPLPWVLADNSLAAEGDHNLCKNHQKTQKNLQK